MLQLLSEKQQKTQNTAQSMRKPEEKDPQKAYTNIKITLATGNNTNMHNTHPQKLSRKEQRLQNAQKSKTNSRNGKRRRKQCRKNK
jgi:hypothetical protein